MLIKLILDRFEGDKAVMKTEDNKYEVVWPKEKLPPHVKEGMSLAFIIASGAKDDDFNQRLAKDILNEILNTGE